MRTSLPLTTGLLGTTLALIVSCTMDRAGLSDTASTSASAASGGGSALASSAASGSGGAGGISAASSSGSSSSAVSSSSGTGGSGTGGGDAGTPITVAGELLVDLDVDDPTAGMAMWNNKGTLGGVFTAQGAPTKGVSGGKSAVLFDGQDDGYLGPPSDPTMQGKGDRSIEIWVLNPAVDADEETMISWSNRKPWEMGTMMSFNYGSSIYFGAVTHWSQPDLPWGPAAGAAPPENQWHHLAYTYNGTTATVFADGVKKMGRDVKLDTKKDFSINLAVQRDGTAFTRRGSLAIAVVRIHAGALTAAAVQSNYEAELMRFQ